MSNTIRDRFQKAKQQVDAELQYNKKTEAKQVAFSKRERSWLKFNKKYMWPVLGAGLTLFSYYLFQTLQLRFESENDTQEKLKQNMQRDLMASRVGMYRVVKDADIDDKARVLEKKLEDRLEDYDFKRIQKEEEEENF